MNWDRMEGNWKQVTGKSPGSNRSKMRGAVKAHRPVRHGVTQFK